MTDRQQSLIDALMRLSVKQREQIAVLTAALRFYADRANYDGMQAPIILHPDGTLAGWDEGETARKALEEIEG